jgi:glycosyltransferase involved in cell wall biosynthesis
MVDLKTLVSIVIPAYNTEGTIRRAIDSILVQTYKPIEIIVVDDGSKDGTEAVCRTYGDRIRYIKQDNGGAAAARNTGIRNANGDFVGFLDADDWYLPEKIKHDIKLFALYPEVGAVTSAFVQRTASGDMVTPQAGRVFGGAEEARLVDYFLSESQGNWIVTTNTILIRREVLDVVGVFNVDLTYGEDIDLWCRIAGGFDVVYQDKALSYYDRTNETSLCGSVSVLDHGIDFLYGSQEIKKYICEDKRTSYLRFRNKILFGRLMLSIYEKNRPMVLLCLRKLVPLPPNIRVLLALALLPLPAAWWPRNKRGG